MKCIKLNTGHGGRIIRVKNKVAERKVRLSYAKYACKEDWKREGRHYG